MDTPENMKLALVMCFEESRIASLQLLDIQEEGFRRNNLPPEVFEFMSRVRAEFNEMYTTKIESLKSSIPV